MRDVLLTIHILAAAGFIGGGLYSAVVFPGDVRAMGLRRVMARDKVLGSRFFGAAVAVLVLSGIGLVVDSSVYGFGDAFVLVGIGAIVVSGLAEGVLVGPVLKREAELSDDPGPPVLRAMRLDAGVHIVVFVVAVYAMVVRLGA